MPFPALVFSRGLWMYSFTLDFGKPQRMVRIWEGWEYNVRRRKSTPRPKDLARLQMEATPRTCLRSCPLLFASSACWRLPLVLALHSCSASSHQDEPEGAAWSRKSWAVLAAWALPVDYRMSLGFRAWWPWVCLGRSSQPWAFGASGCLYSPSPERHCSKCSGLLHLLSSKFSSPRWKYALLLLYWKRKENKCFQKTHSLDGFHRSKNKHLECDRGITVITYHGLREDKPDVLGAL